MQRTRANLGEHTLYRTDSDEYPGSLILYRSRGGELSAENPCVDIGGRDTAEATTFVGCAILSRTVCRRWGNEPIEMRWISFVVKSLCLAQTTITQYTKAQHPHTEDNIMSMTNAADGVTIRLLLLTSICQCHVFTCWVPKDMHSRGSRSGPGWRMLKVGMNMSLINCFSSRCYQYTLTIKRYQFLNTRPPITLKSSL